MGRLNNGGIIDYPCVGLFCRLVFGSIAPMFWGDFKHMARSVAHRKGMIMLYFKTRSAARAFAAVSGRKVKDLGASAAKRWAVVVL